MRRIIAAVIGAALAATAATCGQKGPLTPKPLPAANAPALSAQPIHDHAVRP